AFAGGAWTAPAFVVQGSSHGSVGDAFAAVDGALAGLDERVGILESTPGGTPGPRGLSAYEVAVGNGYTGSEDDWLASLVRPPGPAGGGDGLTEAEAQAVAGDVSEAGDTATRASAGAATDEREVAIREDMDSGDAATLSSANRYTDTAIQQLIGFDAGGLNDRMAVLEDRFDQLDRRLHRQDRRIDRMGAMGTAMLNMAINAAGAASAGRRGATASAWVALRSRSAVRSAATTAPPASASASTSEHAPAVPGTQAPAPAGVFRYPTADLALTRPCARGWQPRHHG